MRKFVKQIMAALMMTVLVSAGAFAQGKGKDKRPPKEPVKVIEGKGGGGGGGKPPQPPPKPPKRDEKKKP